MTDNNYIAQVTSDDRVVTLKRDNGKYIVDYLVVLGDDDFALPIMKTFEFNSRNEAFDCFRRII